MIIIICKRVHLLSLNHTATTFTFVFSRERDFIHLNGSVHCAWHAQFVSMVV